MLNALGEQTSLGRAIERTPARVERGRYLAENVLDCVNGCHTKRDFRRFGFTDVLNLPGVVED